MSAPEPVELSRMTGPLPAIGLTMPGARAWTIPAGPQLRQWPLPAMGVLDRWLTRTLLKIARPQLGAVRGLDSLRDAGDPFIVAVSHSTRREALLLPA